MEKKKPSTAQGVFSLLVFGALLYLFFGGGMEKMGATSLQSIHDQVAADSLAQYNIAARNGNQMDKCVQAGLVAAAYLQATNEAEYAHWKFIRDNDCAAAGLPTR